MEKISFNEDWKCYRKGEKDAAIDVRLPHDAMLLDGKSETSPGGVNNGWVDAHDYVYEKAFDVPEGWSGKTAILEFEGVYHKASVYLNGEKIAYQNYGYIGFYVDVTDRLRQGETNELRVEAVNSDQPNSRWYSGTGIYRPVWMYLLPSAHIQLDGIRVTTLDYRRPRVRVDVEVAGKGGDIRVEILDGADAGRVEASAEGTADGRFSCEIDLPGARTWSPEAPALHICRVTFGEDVQEARFGIRLLEFSPKTGFRINGKRTILRGACIHHDNGILGACAYGFAERRKARLLKENGYNAIRSAHNPCSKALLDACDELGMLVMDEYVDVWYIHKTKHDYATEVEGHYKEDLRAIVRKDYNHPSVVLYSTGNEVAETARRRGIALCGEMTRCLHELDATRPVTCGINIFFNFLNSIGFGVYSDKKADQAAKDASKKKAVGSEFFNRLAGVFGSGFMKLGATLYPCDVKTRDAFAKMDVAGYNYGILRYRHDLRKYPDRLILGSETFCQDAYRFWENAKRSRRIVGDFVWAGMDYLGEVGIGSWEYADYAPRFNQGKGWVSAGSGRIDLTGKPLSEMQYTRVAFELDDIGIGVVPVNHTKDRHSPSAWKMTNAMESWSWNGCDGASAKVEVYTRADRVALFLNGRKVGEKKRRGDCRVTFRIRYHDGELKAVAYDAQGQKAAERTLRTAGRETMLRLEPEQEKVRRADGLCYVRMRLTDGNGTLKPLARSEIRVAVEGGTLLGLGSACPYYEKSYLGDVADTYYGEALAIVRPGASGDVIVSAESKYGKARTVIPIVDEAASLPANR